MARHLDQDKASHRVPSTRMMRKSNRVLEDMEGRKILRQMKDVGKND
jgi:hypothetical protein